MTKDAEQERFDFWAGVVAFLVIGGLVLTLIIIIVNGLQDQAACEALEGRYAQGTCYEKSPEIKLP